MFVISVKASKRRLITVILCIAVITAIFIASLCFPADRTMMTKADRVAGDSDEACAAYLKSIGYTAILPASSVREIQLPDTFDNALNAYNTLQQQAGFDLSLYAGQRVKYRTYELSDYPGDQLVLAHLYTHDGIIIGGDIESLAGDFIKPLCKTVPADC